MADLWARIEQKLPELHTYCYALNERENGLPEYRRKSPSLTEREETQWEFFHGLIAILRMVSARR